MNETVEVKKNMNTTIILNKEDVNNPLHPNLYAQWLEQFNIDPDATGVCLKLSPLDENKPDMRNVEEEEDEEEKADENYTTEILLHTVSYYFRETELKMDECGEEHIKSMMGQGYIEGELNRTDPDDPEKVYHGWWSIKKHNI